MTAAQSRNESLNKRRADAEIAVGTCRQQLSTLQLAHKHLEVRETASLTGLCVERMWIVMGVELSMSELLQERAEQITKQLQSVFSTLQRGVADGLTVLGSTRHANAS